MTHQRKATPTPRRVLAGTTNGAELMKAIRATHIAGHVMIGGPIMFDDKGQNNNIPSARLQNCNRTPRVMLPAEITMAPVFSMPPWQGQELRYRLADFKTGARKITDCHAPPPALGKKI